MNDSTTSNNNDNNNNHLCERDIHIARENNIPVTTGYRSIQYAVYHIYIFLTINGINMGAAAASATVTFGAAQARI